MCFDVFRKYPRWVKKRLGTFDTSIVILESSISDDFLKFRDKFVKKKIISLIPMLEQRMDNSVLYKRQRKQKYLVFHMKFKDYFTSCNNIKTEEK